LPAVAAALTVSTVCQVCRGRWSHVHVNRTHSFLYQSESTLSPRC